MRATPLLIAGLLATPLAGGCVASARAGGGLLAVGAPAPDLQATDQHGAVHRLASERGRVVVVYFYPRDETPGCTREACAFRDVWARYRAAGVQVFGVSTDDQASHQRFAAKHQLPFPLLADPQRAWTKAFGVPVTLGLAARVTFLVGPDGRVARVYPKVDPGVHASEVLADAARLR